MPTLSEAAVGISAVRVWPAPEYTRITIESARPIEYTLFTTRNPDRLVLDLEDVESSAQLDGLPARVGVDDPYIAQVRVGRNRPGVVRLVLELRGEIKPQAFSLKPVGEYAHRLVLDIYPAHPVDPLMALVEQLDREKASVAAAAPESVSQQRPEPQFATQPACTNQQGAASSGNGTGQARGQAQPHAQGPTADRSRTGW